MDSTTSSSLALDPSATPGAAAAAPRRTAWWVAGGLGVVGAGALAAALTSSPKPAPVEPAAPVAAVAPAKGKTAHAAKPAPAATTAAADTCASCGTVESVKAETRKGEGTGLGAVAGGVLGGVVGHQVGGGNGKKAMTVLGAVGGGFAGHEVEKRARSTTVYQVRLRMDDGTTRTVTQQTAPAVGGRFEVEGSTLKAIPLPKA
jgi:outer membrane lipoprotein SlyB